MAYPQVSNEFQPAPPPYSPNDKTNSETAYQSGKPNLGQSPYGVSQPPPSVAMYNQPSPSVVMYPQRTTVVQHIGAVLSHYPQLMQCPSCQQQILTEVRYESGGITWLIAFLICVFGGIFGCCLIPFCVPTCQDAMHTCPACHNLIGRRSPF